MNNLRKELTIFEEDYVKIPLFNQQKEVIEYFIIDKDKYEEVIKYTCYLYTKTISKNVYKTVVIKINNKQMNLSHFIFGKPKNDNVIDHINNNALDNRIKNLQEVSKSHNSQNRKKMSSNASSKYIGVCYSKRDNKWQSNCSGKNLGLFKDEIDAAKMYDKYVLVKYGENASTNNLINYEEVKDLTVEDIKPSKKERELPLNIYKSQTNLYFAKITYNKKQYLSECKINLEEAINDLKNIKEEIKKIKEEEEKIHNNKEITRNSNGEAVINIFNKNKEKIAETIVDEELWYKLSKFGWYLSKKYIQASINCKVTMLHRYIMNCPDDKIIDHIDNNPLNNKKENLRIATLIENSYNSEKSTKTKNTYKGVYTMKNSIRYRTSIRKDNKDYYLGTYDTELQAAVAYNLKATELFGAFAYQNKLDLDNETYEKYKLEIIDNWNKRKMI